jgi:hypothetical protein
MRNISSDLPDATVTQLYKDYSDINQFALTFIGIQLRKYQLLAANAIIDSVQERDGKTIVIIFARQSGKDELLACVTLYLMYLYQEKGIDIICAQPTFKPQTINAMERLKKRGHVFRHWLSRTAGYIMRYRASRVLYFSADASAHQVGATADRLIIMNEAQDISSAIYDKRFSPMGISGNATRVFSGTAWTTGSLLEREKLSAFKQQRKSKTQQVFMVDALEVSKENKLYKKYLKQEVDKLGRQHPLIKTQYYNELIDAHVTMFNAARRALMRGDMPPLQAPRAGYSYAFTIDVGGMDEAILELEGLGNPGRDSTTLSIIEIDLSQLSTQRKPIYRVVKRMSWQGLAHVKIFGQLSAIVDQWRAQYIIVDATGIGEGLWSLMAAKYPTRTIPVKFTQQKKSEIAYGFIGIIETGRFRDCDPSNLVDQQYANITSEILPGPQKTIRWGVKDGTRSTDGTLIHDDHVIADAMTYELDELDWIIYVSSAIVEYPDPLIAMDRNY